MNFRKYILLLALLFSPVTFSFAQQNITLLSHITYPQGVTLAGVWQYVDTSGKEYALIGARTGVDIYDLTVPTAPNLILSVPGIHNLWREIKTWGNYAYVTTEGLDTVNTSNNGLQIINLSYLPDSAPSKIWKGDGTINNQLQRGHTVTVANGYVFVNGSNLAGGGVIIADISDPWNPHYVGQYSVHYVHDSHVRGNKLWVSEVNPGQFSVVDITVPSNPVVLAAQPAFGAICHNGGLSDNGNYFYATVEIHGAPLGAYDVSNVGNITLVDTYFSTDSALYEVHNVRVLNDFLVNACYGSQVTIVDAARPHNLIQVGNYFTGGALCWDVSPYLPSGNILATDEHGGFYVLAPTYVRACYLEGTVTDSITGNPVNNAQVQILTTPVQANTTFTGQYATGIAQAAAYDVQYSAAGYFTKTITAVALNNGLLTTLNVELVPDWFSVNEITSENLFSIFPNPATSKLIISNGELKIESIEIYDVMGKRVFPSPLVPLSSRRGDERGEVINISSLSHGIYFLTVTDKDKNRVTKKFIKL